MPSGAMLINAASPPIISIELATGRVRPLADKECSIHQGYGHIHFLQHDALKVAPVPEQVNPVQREQSDG